MFEKTELARRWDKLGDRIKLDGGPGSGKTTNLRAALKKYPETLDWYYLTFSTAATQKERSAIEEIDHDRYGIKFEMDEDEGGKDYSHHVRTLHSICLGISYCDAQDIIDPGSEIHEVIKRGGEKVYINYYEEFFDRFGIDFQVDQRDPVEIVENHSKKPLGNQLLNVHNFIRVRYGSNNYEPEKIRNAPDIPLSVSRTREMLNAWDEFKQKRGLAEHTDYILDVANNDKIPAADLILLDELQDFSPIEHKVLANWLNSDIDMMIFAGDPDQSIYSWRGAAPQLFEAAPCSNRIMLEDSYRCPRSVCEIARHIYDGSKNLTATDGGGGEIEKRSISTFDDFAEFVSERHTDDTLVLSRTNYQVGKLTQSLIDNGIPFKNIGKPTGWKRWMLTAVAICETLQGNEEIPVTVWNSLVGKLDVLDGGKVARTNDNRITRAELNTRQSAIDTKDLVAFIETLADTKRQERQMKNAVAADGKTPDPVQIGTFHSSKGLECENVIISAEIPTRSQNALNGLEEAGEELRTFYVALTRSSEKITIVNDLFGWSSFDRLNELID